MTFEQLVGDALHAADDYQPSPDLFAKVRLSIDEDAAHRARVRRTALWAFAGLIAVLAYLVVTVEVAGGTVSMSFRSLELLVTGLMIVALIVVGPAIRRFGKTYESDVFSASPETGRDVLRLLDFSYYLIFTAYILMSLEFGPSADLGSDLAGWVRLEALRLGGLFMLMGVLHIVLLLALPIVGLVFAANQRRARIAFGYESTDAVVDRIDRAITVAAWVVAGLAVLQLLFGVVNVFIVLGSQ